MRKKTRSTLFPPPKVRRGKDFYPIEVDKLVARAVALKLIRTACELSIAEAATLVGIKLDEYADFEVPLVVGQIYAHTESFQCRQRALDNEET